MIVVGTADVTSAFVRVAKLTDCQATACDAQEVFASATLIHR